ncbi:PREDICTED: uncharacterized protein LOC109117180 [Tarenaya hassleriana]|uniref:uncharacterized protein LOC109117180 n=1 Tax=Tarenaya hassleriana TaxID=28532 RepID=UPI0008FCFB82|nr:PREDICTED: uncharacterized protein LOC109117180 [Tarenaya hassleriana]
MADTSLFILRAKEFHLFVLVYVDDLIVTGSCPNRIQEFITSLAARFSLKDLGLLSFFLGIEASRSAKGLFLCQCKYISDLLHRNNMHDAKAVSTPMASTSRLTLKSDWAGDPGDFKSTGAFVVYLGKHPISWSSKKLSVTLDPPPKPSTVESGSLRVLHVSSRDQLANVLTKPLPRNSFHDLIAKIGITSGAPT